MKKNESLSLRFYMFSDIKSIRERIAIVDALFFTALRLLEGKRCLETFTLELSAIPIKTVPGIMSLIC